MYDRVTQEWYIIIDYTTLQWRVPWVFTRRQPIRKRASKIHPELASKDLAYFKINEHHLKRSRLDNETGDLLEPSNFVKGSYRTSFLIAKQKKPHTTGGMLIKPCMVKAACHVLAQKFVKKLNQMSFGEHS
ncbi:protein FAM200C-like [Palaemon carinicauda]|uniref:protein FAM200C-like n=1 Tax=Palaemon carinicauda TaxID=392227 RepID=UPI0035B64653